MLEKGDRVYHKRNGWGTVTCSCSNSVEVDFDECEVEGCMKKYELSLEDTKNDTSSEY